jgi:hypothetical protein
MDIGQGKNRVHSWFGLRSEFMMSFDGPLPRSGMQREKTFNIQHSRVSNSGAHWRLGVEG